MSICGRWPTLCSRMHAISICAQIRLASGKMMPKSPICAAACRACACAAALVQVTDDALAEKRCVRPRLPGAISVSPNRKSIADLSTAFYKGETGNVALLLADLTQPTKLSSHSSKPSSANRTCPAWRNTLISETTCLRDCMLHY